MKIFEYRGGRGDSLMLTSVCHEWKKRGEEVGVVTHDLEVFENNPDIDWVIPREGRHHRRFQRVVNEIVHPNYLLGFNKAEDTRDPLNEHVLVFMNRRSGITGEIEARPWFFPRNERTAVDEEMIVFQSSGIGAQSYSPNKEWILERMRQVVAWTNRRWVTVQIGGFNDPRLDCDINYQGLLSLNKLGLVLKKVRLFVGLESMIMHMARAVDCPGVIIYGGRLKPWQIGYTGNYNIISKCPEQRYAMMGCWRQSKCDHIREDREKTRTCMDNISVNDVIVGIKTMLSRKREVIDERFLIER